MTGVNSLPCGWLLPELKVPPHMPLASDAARCVGDPVAIVIAESHDAAEDAAEKVKVTWEVLPAVSATDKATAKGSTQIHELAPSNTALTSQIGDAAALEPAFPGAARVVNTNIVNRRLATNPIEPRT